MGTTRTCICQNPECQKTFTTNNPNHSGKYCSNACYKAARWPGQRRFTVPCTQCGKEVERKKNELEASKQVFCSRSCHDAWRHAHGPRGENHHQYSRVEVICDQCGKTFRKNPFAVANRNARFCSKDCQNNWNRLNAPNLQMGSKNPRYTQQSVACAQCGQTVSRQPWQIEGYAIQFCNSVCMGAWRAEHLTGENSPNWRGGHPEYYGPNWEQQRRKARQRDGYTCQHCGRNERELGRELDVHHITPFRRFGYMRGQNDAYQTANRLENLISLCNPCHKRAEDRTL